MVSEFEESPVVAGNSSGRSPRGVDGIADEFTFLPQNQNNQVTFDDANASKYDKEDGSIEDTLDLMELDMPDELRCKLSLKD